MARPTSLTIIFFGLSLSLPAADSKGKAASDAKEVDAYYASLPAPAIPPFTQEQALALVAMPLSCLDHPQALPEQRVEYLWVHSAGPRILDGYDKNRAFYGCFDWHSAVNSTWTLITVLKQFPTIAVGPLIREKLKEHLGRKNMEGEMEFFKTARNFEVPYGYGWLLKLYAELVTWNDPEGKVWAENVAPLVQQFSKKLVEYMTDLSVATRLGAHANTAFAMNLMLDYTEVVHDPALEDILQKTAMRFFLPDKNCPTAYEPGGTDFLSPCLTEARLMSKLLDQPRFATWLNDFLPAVYSEAFKPLTVPVDVSGITKQDLLAGKSHLIALAFLRAEALIAIANALPADDHRAAVYRRVAAINARGGFQALAGAGYFGSHFLGTFGVMCGRALSPDAGSAVAEKPPGKTSVQI